MPIGSTTRTTGLVIPAEWEEEFRSKHPLSERRAKGDRLFKLLKRGMERAKVKDENKTEALIGTDEAQVDGQGGAQERRSG